MPGRVALPTRSPFAQDDPNYVPRVSEYSGTVALAERQVLVWRLPDGSTTVVPQAGGVPGAVAELVPSTIPEAPRPVPWVGGQYGTVEQPTRRFMFNRDNPWKVSAMNWAASQIAWLRRDFPNTDGMRGFVPVNAATTDATTNSTDGRATSPATPIPYSFKRQVWTLSREYDDTIWATYRAPEKFQNPANMRAYLATQGYTQLPPYFPRLTQYQTPRSFGQLSQTLPPYPYGTGSSPYAITQPVVPTSSGYPMPVSGQMFGSY